MDKVKLFSDRVYLIAEDDTYSDTYKAKFVISDFSINHNTVGINRKKIDNWKNTIIYKPLVGKLISNVSGDADFSGHNMHVTTKRDEDGNVYKDVEFDTNAFGTFTDVAIEDIDGDECIVATCKIWKRFTNACTVIMKRIEEGTLNTSWEIDVLASHKEIVDGRVVKIIDDGIFTAHCLLGANVRPAYDCSRLLEVAEATSDELDVEIADAIAQDFEAFASTNSEDKEDSKVELEDKKNLNSEDGAAANADTAEQHEQTDVTTTEADTASEVVAEESAPSVDNAENNTEVIEQPLSAEKEASASITEHDLYNMLYTALKRKMLDNDWYIAFVFPVENAVLVKHYSAKDLEFTRFAYEVANGEIVLSEGEDVELVVSVLNINDAIAERENKIAEMNSALAHANSEIQDKNAEIASLTVYKEQVEKAERDRAEAELRQQKDALKQYAISSGLINEDEVSENGELASLIEQNDEAGIKAVIAERYMRSAKKATKDVETSESKVKKANVKANLSNVGYSANDIMKAYLGTK